MLRCSAVDDEELAEVEALIELKVRIRPGPLLSLALWHSRGLWPNGQKRKLELLKRKKGKAAESKGDTKSDGAADESQSTCDGGVCRRRRVTIWSRIPLPACRSRPLVPTRDGTPTASAIAILVATRTSPA